MFFNVLWTILLGVIGGIISSLIVSKVFLIQGKHQSQLSFVAQIVRKLNYISAFLQSAKAIFEVSYDTDLEIQREMQEKGYKTEMEYYYAHKDKDWIKKSDVLEVIRKEITKTADMINTDVANTPIDDPKLIELLRDIMVHVHEVSSVKELSFSSIGDFEKKERDLIERYDNCVQKSGKTLLKLIMRDKLMIILFVLVIVLVVCTVLTGLLKI